MGNGTDTLTIIEGQRSELLAEEEGKTADASKNLLKFLNNPGHFNPGNRG
jgi:hypothetical protein